MDRGENVVTHDTLGNEDGILEVIAVPGHEGDQHVAPQSQFTEVGGRSVGDDVAHLDLFPHLDQRPLVDTGVLVGTLELRQVVNVHAGGRMGGFLGSAHHNAGPVDLNDGARALGDNRSTRIARHLLFHAGANNGGLRADERHRLALHV